MAATAPASSLGDLPDHVLILVGESLSRDSPRSLGALCASSSALNHALTCADAETLWKACCQQHGVDRSSKASSSGGRSEFRAIDTTALWDGIL